MLAFGTNVNLFVTLSSDIGVALHMLAKFTTFNRSFVKRLLYIFTIASNKVMGVDQVLRLH